VSIGGVRHLGGWARRSVGGVYQHLAVRISDRAIWYEQDGVRLSGPVGHQMQVVVGNGEAVVVTHALDMT